MIGVVCCHYGWSVIPGFTAFFSRFGSWGVDIFLFLSGFGCVYALNKYSTSIFLKKRFLRLMPTCIIAGIFIYCIDLYFHAERTITYFPVRVLSLNRWYIQAILICYLLSPFAYSILKKYRAIGLLVMICCFIITQSFIPYDRVWKISWIFNRLPVFLIGMYVASFDLKLNRFLYIASGQCLAAAIIIRCLEINGVDSIIPWVWFLAASMPFVCYTLSLIKPIFDKLHLTKMVELFGLYSLEIYLIHEYFLWALYAVTIPLWCKYILYLLLVISICVILKATAKLIQGRLQKLIV